MIRTPICDMLGIQYPVFQGGMAWISDGKLAAAVSNGGGLGIIAAGNAPAKIVREEIHIAKSLTDKPFGVNIMLMSPYADEIAALVCEERVAVVTTGAGNPSKYMENFRKAGIRVIPVVASVAMAKLMTGLGASALIAEGGESGGHVGELTTMVLVPMICDATDLPVLAAGGIVDGRGVAAAFLLGACGVQMGTRAGLGGVMRLLYMEKEPITAGAISEKLGISTARVAVLLKKLEAKGTISRLRDPADARKTLVQLTDSGMEWIQETWKKIRDQMGKMIDTIGEERLMEFIEVGIEIRKIMKELPEDVEELEGEDR